MKKFFAVAAVAGMAVLASCGNAEDLAKKMQDSINKADSMMKEQMKADSAKAADSIKAATDAAEAQRKADSAKVADSVANATKKK